MYSSADLAHSRKVLILKLRSEDKLGFGAIAKIVGCSRGYVQQVCNGSVAAPSVVDPASIKAAALAIKSEDMSLGSVQVLAKLVSIFPADLLPSQSTLERWFSASSLTRKQLHFSTGSRAYWHEDRPTAACQRWEIDTVKLHVSGRTIEVLTVTDWYSRLSWAEVMADKSFASYLPWFLQRSFDALGVPETIQVDNGFGFILPRRNVLSAFCRFAFQSGVKKVEFIPVAEAQRNGRIESFNGWLKFHYEKYGKSVKTVADLRSFVSDALSHFNTEKYHLGISTRRKGGYKVPSQMGAYNHLSVAAPSVLSVPQAVQSGTIAYKRLVFEHGEAFVNAPNMLFLLSPRLFGHYVTIELPIGDLGRVTWARLTGDAADIQVVGTFEHELMGVVTDGFVQVDLLHIECDPIPFDMVRKMEHDRKHLKQARKPAYCPAGFELCDLSDGSWAFYLDGEMVYSSQCSQVEHASEVLPVE